MLALRGTRDDGEGARPETDTGRRTLARRRAVRILLATGALTGALLAACALLL